MRVLFIGDIVGRPGRRIVRKMLSQIQREHQVDFTIANAENSAGGKGITRDVFRELYTCGIDAFTMGNHIWDNRAVFEFINEEERLIRPANYPDICPGRGYNIYQLCYNKTIAVINASGRVFLPALDCPFRTVSEILSTLKDAADYILIDFHAEATSEKLAFARYFEGKVSAIIGTHTHVQTADECILPGGTAYITDAGMTGPSDSIIGMEKSTIINKFISGMPARFEVASGPAQMDTVLIELDENSCRAKSIKRLKFTCNEHD